MRLFASLLVIAAAAYIAFVVITRNHTPPAEATPEPATTTGEVAAQRAPQATPGNLPPESSAPSASAAPAFKSKIPIPDGPPGEKHLAPTDTFYVLERVSFVHDTGVAAVVPGDSVRLVKRNPNGTMKVRAGLHEFEVKESQVTNDLDLARDAERKFVLEHPTAR